MTDARGIGDRGTANRRAAVRLQPPADYPPFHVSILGLAGAGAIPDALAYALKWHLELMRAPDPTAAKELADNLIAIWEFLKEMEAASPRAPDGALLVHDHLAVFARAKIETELVELATGETILVTRQRTDAPLPVWQPTLFPPELPPDVKADYPARPRSVEETPPFYPAVVERWMLVSVRAEDPLEPVRPLTPEPGDNSVAVENFEIQEPPTELKEDEDQSEKAIQAAARTFDSTRWTAERLAAFTGYTPTVNAALARLRSTTLNDITRHTGAKFESAYGDVPLINNTEFILYHSVCSFVLDKNGEPFDLRLSRGGQGLIDYPILIEAPGEQMRRSVPADDGVYVSVKKYGDSKFRLNDAGVTKLLFGTVGGFTEYGYGYSGPHRLHKILQGYLDRGGRYGFVAAVTVPGVYAREEITWSRIRTRIPEFVEVVTPYLVKEVFARASRKLENWEAFITEIVEKVIKQLILDKIRNKLRDYLIKKVGKRIVPGLNAVSALVDLFTGGQERTRMRNIIACMMVALHSKAEEDLHISAKTCAKVVADEFEDAVMNALIQHSKKGVAKLSKKSGAQRDADEKAPKSPPKEVSPAPTVPSPPKAEPRPAPAPAQRGRTQDVAQPRNVEKHGPPTSLEAPTRKDGAQNIKASHKATDSPTSTPVKTAPEVTVIPRRANKREREMLRKAHEKQERHDKKIAEKIKKLKEAELQRQTEQRVAANGGTATGGDNKATGAKKTEGATTESTGTKETAAPAKPAAPKKPLTPIKPLDPNQANVVHVKEPKPLADTHDVQGERKVRTGAHSDEKLGRAELEKKGGAMGIGEQAHHGTQKKGAGDTGEAAREAIRTGGGSVNQPSNIAPAMGPTNDPRAIHGSSAAHSSMHGKHDAETARQMAETRKSDPEGLKSAQADFSTALYEGRRPKRDDFYLGGDPDPTEPRPPRAPKPKR